MTTDESESSESPEREEIMALLEDGLQEAHRKVTSGRVRDEEKERVRIQWIRALAYAAGQYRQLKRDEQIDELEERIEAIGEQQSGSDYQLK